MYGKGLAFLRSALWTRVEVSKWTKAFLASARAWCTKANRLSGSAWSSRDPRSALLSSSTDDGGPVGSFQVPTETVSNPRAGASSSWRGSTHPRRSVADPGRQTESVLRLFSPSLLELPRDVQLECLGVSKGACHVRRKIGLARHDCEVLGRTVGRQVHRRWMASRHRAEEGRPSPTRTTSTS